MLDRRSGRPFEMTRVEYAHGYSNQESGRQPFLPPGTIRYWQAWAYLAVFFGASFLITLYLAKNDPALLKRRLRGGPWAEKERAQKIIMVFTWIGFIALIVVPALDFRFGCTADARGGGRCAGCGRLHQYLLGL